MLKKKNLEKDKIGWKRAKSSKKYCEWENSEKEIVTQKQKVTKINKKNSVSSAPKLVKLNVVAQEIRKVREWKRLWMGKGMLEEVNREQYDVPN